MLKESDLIQSVHAMMFIHEKISGFLFLKKGTKSTQSSSVFIPLVNNLLQKSGFLIDLLKSILRSA